MAQVQRAAPRNTGCGAEGRRGGSSRWVRFPSLGFRCSVLAGSSRPRSALHNVGSVQCRHAAWPREMRMRCDTRARANDEERNAGSAVACKCVYYTSLWSLLARVRSAQYCGSRKAKYRPQIRQNNSLISSFKDFAFHSLNSVYSVCGLCGGGRAVRGEYGIQITVGCGVRDVPISSCGIRHTATPHSAATAGSSNDFSRLATLSVKKSDYYIHTACRFVCMC